LHYFTKEPDLSRETVPLRIENACVQGEEEQEQYVKDATDKGSKVLHTLLTNGTELVTNIRLAAQNLQVSNITPA